MIDVKVDGTKVDFSAQGSTKEIIEDAVRVVVAVCESLARNSRCDDKDGLKDYLLHRIIKRLVDINIGAAGTTSVIFDKEAAAREVGRTEQ